MQRRVQRSDSLSLALLIPSPLIFVSNQIYFFVSFGKSEQICVCFIISPSFLHKRWHTVHTLLQFAFCQLTIQPGIYSILVHGDNLHSFLTVPGYSSVYLCHVCLFNQSPIFEHLRTLQYFAVIQKCNSEKPCAYCWSAYWYFQGKFLEMGLLSPRLSDYMVVLDISNFPPWRLYPFSSPLTMCEALYFLATSPTRCIIKLLNFCQYYG